MTPPIGYRLYGAVDNAEPVDFHKIVTAQSQNCFGGVMTPPYKNIREYQL